MQSVIKLMKMYEERAPMFDFDNQPTSVLLCTMSQYTLTIMFYSLFRYVKKILDLLLPFGQIVSRSAFDSTIYNTFLVGPIYWINCEVPLY